MTVAVLQAENLTKTYPGVQALDDVSIEIRPREVVGLVGENGAGKSTLLKVLAGLLPADSGRITVLGREVPQGSYRAASAAGIGMVFQEQSLLPNMSVAENIMLGHEGAAVRFGLYSWDTLNAIAARQLQKIGAEISLQTPTESLSFAERQLVEFAKVLLLEERVKHEPIILLDEPTSVLDADELELVLSQIELLKKRASVVFVSHRLEEVLRVSDRVYVMTNGRRVAERIAGDCDVGELQQLMLGRELSGLYSARPMEATRSAPVRLRVENLSLKGSFEGISFRLSGGEVLGIAGVEGSGREMLCRCLFGAANPSGGAIWLDDAEIAFATPADAVQSGIGYLPAERRVEGIIGGLTVKENITLAHPESVQRGPFLDGRQEEKLVRQWIARLNIKTPSTNTPAANLSGGNQQKVVLSKWLIAQNTKVLVLDHPMRGLDVGAKAEIFALCRDLRQGNLGIILIADTLDELIALSDAIIVMRDGRISGRLEVSSDGPKPLDVLRLMV